MALIGMSNRISGRLGNYLFHVNLLLQVAHLKNFDLRVPPYKRSSSVRVRERHQTGFLDDSAQIISDSVLYEKDGEQAKAIAEHWKRLGTDISIPALLSPQEIFIPFTFVDPAKFFRIRNLNLAKYVDRLNRPSPQFPRKRLRVGLHFRGTDFRYWDASALMPERFFHEGVEAIAELWGHQDFHIELFTDDVSSPVVQGLVGQGIPLRARSSSQDFRALAEMDAIVASPSTFSFWAAMLGGKKIVFQQAWVKKRAKLGSSFWGAALRNQLPHIEVHTV